MDLAGRNCIVTGATSGIGQATAVALAARGASLGLLCRDLGKGERTLERIRTQTDNGEIRLFRADLESQAQVRAVAAEILDAFPRIHLLLNNAGVVNLHYSETVDGIETVFAVNHLACFLLTQLLLERLRESAPARIVNVASHAHKFVGQIDFEDPGHREKYASMRVYGLSKLANILFTRELARRLAGSGVTANSLHPGAVATGLGANNGGWAKALTRTLGLFFNSPEKGAATSLFVATAPELEGVTGRYFARCRETSTSAAGQDDDAAARLWELSEELTGLAPSRASTPK
ncbi:MAG: SDR family oxidoreductase [Myxococcales bacterium]|nr:SDR family oxidoreductase [Myxococcales bacterium]